MITNVIDLPKGWARCSLDDIAILVRGISFPSNAKEFVATDGVIACLRTKNVQRQVRWKDLWWIPETYVRRQDQIVIRGDILISVSNSADLVGKVAIVGEPPFRSTLGAFIALIRVCPPLDARFVYYLLASPDVQSSIRRVASTTTNISNINSTKIRAIPLALAPSLEQARLADKLDELLSDLDFALNALQRVRKKLGLYRASLLKAAVEGTLTAEWRAQNPNTEPASALLKRVLAERRCRWEEEQHCKFKVQGKNPPRNWTAKYKEPFQPDPFSLPHLPHAWCWASIEQVGEVRLGRQRAPQHHKGDHMRPYLRVANVFEDRLDLSDVKQMNFTPSEFATYALKFGDILLNEGQSPEFVGRPAMYRNEIPDCCYQKTLLRFRSSQSVLPSFALLVFRAYLHSGRFRKSANITTNIAHLVAARFSPMEFPLPPLEEQAVIIDYVENALSVISHLERDLDNRIRISNSLRQSVLRHAFEGKLVPQDPNDEPASELLKRIAAGREERAREAEAAKAANTKVKKSWKRGVKSSESWSEEPTRVELDQEHR